MIGARLRNLLCAAPLALLLTSGPLQAAEITAAQRTSLSQAVESFRTGMATKDMSKVMAVLPARIIDSLAKQAGASPAELRAALAEQTAAVMDGVKISTFNMDLAKARFLQLPNGEPYVIIPTDMVMEFEGRKVEGTSETLAIMDGGAWYLLRVSDANQVKLFTQLYPQYSGLTFKPDVMKAVP